MKVSEIRGGMQHAPRAYRKITESSTRICRENPGCSAAKWGHCLFGEGWYNTGTADPSVLRKFTTYTRDTEASTGQLNYAVFREHGARVGRFHMADPVPGGMRNPQSWNRYAYALGDPTNRTDPLGLLVGMADSGWCAPAAGNCGAFDWMHVDDWAVGGRFGPAAHEAWAKGMQEYMVRLYAAYALAAFGQAARELAEATLGGTFYDAGDCEEDLEALGVSPYAVAAGAMAVNFINGLGSTVPASTLYTNAAEPRIRSAPGVRGTVGDRLAQPGTVAVAELGGHNIYINPLIIVPSNSAENLGTVFHEVLHNVTGLTDPDIQRALDLRQDEPSVNISKKLMRDCFPGR